MIEVSGKELKPMTVNGKEILADSLFAPLLFNRYSFCPVCGNPVDLFINENFKSANVDCVIHCTTADCCVHPSIYARSVSDALSDWSNLCGILNRLKMAVEFGEYKVEVRDNNEN